MNKVNNVELGKMRVEALSLLHYYWKKNELGSVFKLPTNRYNAYNIEDELWKFRNDVVRFFNWPMYDFLRQRVTSAKTPVRIHTIMVYVTGLANWRTSKLFTRNKIRELPRILSQKWYNAQSSPYTKAGKKRLMRLYNTASEVGRVPQRRRT